MSESVEAVLNYARQVKRLLELYRRVQERLDRCGLMEFGVQFGLVEALTDAVLLPPIPPTPQPEVKS